jgi:energy-coupling factor transporter ATP-binding protein EcfA2
MGISSFEFRDRRLGWSVSTFPFERLNLLVGQSGAGKTRILTSLRAVAGAASGAATSLYQCGWTVEVATGGHAYRWTAETGAAPGTRRVGMSVPLVDGDDEVEEDGQEDADPPFQEERLVCDGVELFARTAQGVVIHGAAAPLLKVTESLISMLREDEGVRPLVQFFERFVLSRATARSFRLVYDPQRLQREGVRFGSLASLRADTRLPLALKAWILQDRFPEEFGRLVEGYREIFPTVNTLRFVKSEELLPESERQAAVFGPVQFVDLAIEEQGISRLVRFGSMSLGMRRALNHLLELELAPEGSVILVDEYENSLGVNCLPGLTEHLQSHRRDLQFILTSHHPYVIENIDRRFWKVVTRKGGDVTVRAADTFPALNTRSRQSAFIQLLDVLDRDAAA